MGLSLWIVPDHGTSAKLETFMNIRPNTTEASRTEPKSYPKFYPHITLASLPLSMETNLDTIEKSISRMELPPTCDFAAVERGSHYYRSVYVRIKLSSELVGLHKHIHEALQVDPRTPAFPHLSLCYINDIDAASGERDRYYDTLKDAGKIRDERESEAVSLACRGNEEWLSRFVAHEIWAVRCEGPVEDWAVLKRYTLEPRK